MTVIPGMTYVLFIRIERGRVKYEGEFPSGELALVVSEEPPEPGFLGGTLTLLTRFGCRKVWKGSMRHALVPHRSP